MSVSLAVNAVQPREFDTGIGRARENHIDHRAVNVIAVHGLTTAKREMI